MAKAPKQAQPELQDTVETVNTEPQDAVETTIPEQADTVETTTPVIEYFGEGADKVEFEVDPKAKLMQVYSDGRILTHY